MTEFKLKTLPSNTTKRGNATKVDHAYIFVHEATCKKLEALRSWECVRPRLRN